MIITGILATDNETRSSFVEVSNHQEFQVPKMQVLNLIKLFWWVGVPLHKHISCFFHTALVRSTDSSYLKCLEGSDLQLEST